MHIYIHMYTYTYVCVYEQIYKYTHMYIRVACVFAAAHNILFRELRNAR